MKLNSLYRKKYPPRICTSIIEIFDANTSGPKGVDDPLDVAILDECESNEEFLRGLIDAPPTSSRNAEYNGSAYGGFPKGTRKPVNEMASFVLCRKEEERNENKRGGTQHGGSIERNGTTDGSIDCVSHDNSGSDASTVVKCSSSGCSFDDHYDDALGTTCIGRINDFKRYDKRGRPSTSRAIFERISRRNGAIHESELRDRALRITRAVATNSRRATLEFNCNAPQHDD